MDRGRPQSFFPHQSFLSLDHIILKDPHPATKEQETRIKSHKNKTSLSTKYYSKSKRQSLFLRILTAGPSFSGRSIETTAENVVRKLLPTCKFDVGSALGSRDRWQRGPTGLE